MLVQCAAVDADRLFCTAVHANSCRETQLVAASMWCRPLSRGRCPLACALLPIAAPCASPLAIAIIREQTHKDMHRAYGEHSGCGGWRQMRAGMVHWQGGLCEGGVLGASRWKAQRMYSGGLMHE